MNNKTTLELAGITDNTAKRLILFFVEKLVEKCLEVAIATPKHINALAQE
ncbi:hypothetical protein T07_5076 [Trichinella nelsoni]|uniref:Uncharacterized protein n=1 Tax=Trichinella nelsoni TaxID=6336 RepID=A0A0V0RAL8_9BILA|nr:hypothetical protein T07_5076 [Trichinella nelsoni]